MQIEAIDRHTTADLVVKRIASVIKDRKLSAGERLPGEHELVEQLKVSRPILREALARLQSMGLVDIQRGRGTFVGSATTKWGGDCTRRFSRPFENTTRTRRLKRCSNTCKPCSIGSRRLPNRTTDRFHSHDERKR